MRSGLFFGTFNPVHRGHEALAKSFLSSNRIDELQIILTPSPPHKDQVALAPLEDRLEMLKLVFNGEKNIQISIPEKELPPPHYTVKTLNHIAHNSPSRHFVLCIGGDTLQMLPEWYRFEKIAEKAELLVADRPGVPRTLPGELKSFQIYFCEHDMMDISSSYIRREIAGGRKPPEDYMHPAVEKYILSNRLYLKPDNHSGYVKKH